MLPNPLQQHLESHFDARIIQFTSAAGGCINQGGVFQTNKGHRYFIKHNQAQKFPGMFESETRGLELLASKTKLKVPKVYQSDEVGNYAYLILEAIDSAPVADSMSLNLGHELANLHKNTAPYFGLDHDNYIGSLPQKNNQHNSWIDFYINERLEPQIKQAVDKNLLDSSHIRSMQGLYVRLAEICPYEPSSLIHGDLWGGNYMIDEEGQAVLIDPSVSYSHREMDLAMSKLFSGFPDSFYEHYSEIYPIINGFEKRMDVYQLYYLLVHVNLFGASYIHSVESILNQY